ncbi:MAG: phospholipase [Tannerellaceae bacterium]|jgi:hypothetical protein|nr:phospholipase [Tannerellaceae bacterium]
MFYLILGLVVLGCIAAAIGYFRKTEISEVQELPEVCCGQHEICERDSLLAAVSRKIEYYDDEELDRFSGINAGAYDNESVDEFREVLYTLHEVEVAGWLRSLQLRSIELPDALKDEAFLIVGERRV